MESFVKVLSISSDFSQVATALIAAFAGIQFMHFRCVRRTKLENYLIKARKSSEEVGGAGSGAKSILHLMGNCSMTEAQVLEAAFGNEHIKTWIAADPETNLADTLLFRIDDKYWRTLKSRK